MGKLERQIVRRQQEKREKVQHKLSLSLQKAYDQGFKRGAMEQSEADQKSLITFFQNLEQIDGIGERTAWKVREAFIKYAGEQQGQGK